MIRKIIRSMTQGSVKTKFFLWAMILLGIASVALFIAAWILQLPVFALAALVLLAVAFATVNSVTINTQKAQKSNKDTYDEGKEAHSPQERQRAKARYLASLQSKDVKKILKQHKVTQSHQKLMIDSYQERKLEQVPAFAWRTDKTLHFLVLEGHANEFEIPMDQIRGIYYEKNVTADIEKDYIPFQYSTYIAKMFQDLLPEYAERNVDGELVYQKNLFYLSNGLYITNTETDADVLNSIDAASKNPVPVIYQSGYLTIKNYDPEFGIYRLGFPNREVEEGFVKYLLPFYTSVSAPKTPFEIGQLVREIRSGDYDAFFRRLQSFFADTPYEVIAGQKPERDTELHYRNVLFIVFKLVGLYTQVEYHTSQGRIDLVLKTDRYIYVMEFKLNGTAEEALRQIEERQYALPFASDPRQVFKIGVNFSSVTRNIERWLVE